jgi:hypothetical protein
LKTQEGDLMTILTIFPHRNCKEVGEAGPYREFLKGKNEKIFFGGGIPGHTLGRRKRGWDIGEVEFIVEKRSKGRFCCW